MHVRQQIDFIESNAYEIFVAVNPDEYTTIYAECPEQKIQEIRDGSEFVLGLPRVGGRKAALRDLAILFQPHDHTLFHF